MKTTSALLPLLYSGEGGGEGLRSRIPEHFSQSRKTLTLALSRVQEREPEQTLTARAPNFSLSPLEPRTFFNNSPLTFCTCSLGGACALHGLPAIPASPITSAAPSADEPTHSLASLPQLSSRPGAPARIYLEFRGAAPIPNWGQGLSATTTPAYDINGDPTTFSDTELACIREIWSRVAEKYSPFDIDVTTVDPGVYNVRETARIVIGGDGAWTGGKFGGYAGINGFIGSNSNTAFVFPANLAGGVAKYVGEAASHEAGHTFGLQHQSVINEDGTLADQYNRGDALKAPVMGSSYFSARGVWWSGYTQLGFFQSDLTRVVSNKPFALRADDFADDISSAMALAVSDSVPVHIEGVITKTSDVDTFSFITTGGIMNIRADVAEFGAMLDLQLILTDSAGLPFATADSASLGESIAMDLPAGTYYLQVASHGEYGDVGQYTLTGTLVPEPSTAAILLMGLGLVLNRRPNQNKKARHQNGGLPVFNKNAI